MRGVRLVPAYVALAAAACCARPAPAPPSPVPAAVAGRTRTVTFRCPGADPAPVQYPMTCAFGDPGPLWKDVDPPRDAPGVPRPSRGRRPLEPCVHGISICGVEVRAPEGSRALACGDADGRRHGPAEVVAPDGSLLVQGFCVHGAPVGAWLWWQQGQLAATRTFEMAGAEGVLYIAPDTYTYGDFKLVPVSPVAPRAP